MPIDGVLQFSVDRYLLPLSVSRGSVQLQDAAGMTLPPELQPNVIYDPVARTITLTRPDVKRAWLLADTSYKVTFFPAGLQTIDGALLRTDLPLVFAFRVGPALPPGAVARTVPATLGEPENVSFCNDVLPLFVVKCNLPTCHGSNTDKVANAQAAGLILDSSEGLFQTAIRNRRVAQGSNTGAAAGSAPTDQADFGVDMPLIDPGNPGNSWLMYKIDLAKAPVIPSAPPVFTCGPQQDTTPKHATAYAPLVDALFVNADAERAVLSDRILGREMPYPASGPGGNYATAPLTFQEREIIRMWITRGAPTPACGGCAVGAASK